MAPAPSRWYGPAVPTPRVFHPMPNLIKCEVFQTLGGRPVVNVLWLNDAGHSGGYSAHDVQSAADLVFNHWHDHMLPVQAQQITLVKVVATDYTTSTSPQATSTSSPAQGGAAADYLPPGVAAVFKLGTGLRGGTERGRFYMAGLPPAYIQFGTWTSGGFTAMQTAASAFLSAMTNLPLSLTTVANWCVASRKLASGQQITTCTLNGLPRSQRRREQDH